MSLRVIPGAVEATALRALILARDGQPQARVSPQAPVAVTPLPVSDALRAQLKLNGNIGLFEAVVTGLQEGTDYMLTATNGAVTRHVAFRTLQPASRDLRIVLGSCYYDDAVGIGSSVLRSVYCKGASFKVMAGDNVYLDVAKNLRDTWGGYEETVFRYLQHFWTSRYAELLATLPTFATWDDHEFWNNYPEPQVHLARTRGGLRADYVRAGHECLLVFQAVLNGPVADSRNGALDGERNLSYEIADTGPVSFFVADVRTARTQLKGSTPRFMPEDAFMDLEAWASSLDKPGVLVLGQPLWAHADRTPNVLQKFVDFRLGDFSAQHSRLWEIILGCRHDILILSGDIHHSHAITIAAPNKMVHQFVSSPMCHIPRVTISWGFPPSIGFGAQDQGAVSIREEIKAAGRQLKLHRYVFGTDLANTISVLDFHGLPSGKVSVSGAFLDGQGRAAPSKPAGSRQPEFSQCGYREIFTLQ